MEGKGNSGRRLPDSVLGPADIFPKVSNHRAGAVQFIQYSGRQSFKHICPCRKQGVEMTALRHGGWRTQFTPPIPSPIRRGRSISFPHDPL